MSEYYDQREAGNIRITLDSRESRAETRKPVRSETEQVYVAVKFPTLFQAAMEGDLAALSLALEQGAHPDQRLTRAMLEECIPNLDGDMTFPVEGWTALHFAASAGQLESAALLRARGADMEALTPQSLSAADVALYSAAMERQNFPRGSARYAVACAIALRCEAFAEAITPMARGRH